MYQARIGSPFGPLLICAGAKGVTGLYFSDQKDCPKVAGAVTARADSLRPSSGMAGKVPLRTLRPVRCAQHKAHIGQGPHYQDLAATAPQLLQENVPETVRDLFNGAQRELLQYFAGTRTQFGFPLDFSGTPFQSKVWRALCNVPYGQVISYGQLALRAGLSPRHGRAVG
ncbi:MAG TPA: MGMT family protein, partial [Pusillimonas sp.]|uniref:methylated-DNA--[protein]-cysteine S-methyltransferase n=1 Tax=Pusillimonas sp. TaxID=3040095 RepID=UPI002C5021A1